MGIDNEGMEGAIRFSLSSMNTKEDIDYCIEKLGPIVNELRKYKRR
jgi:cysteine desulfurase